MPISSIADINIPRSAQLATRAIPSLTTTGASAVKLATAGRTSMRVLVRAFGPPGAQVLISFDPAGISGGTESSAFLLPVDDEDVFVIDPDTALYAIADAAGCKVSVAVSEAVPLTRSGDRLVHLDELLVDRHKRCM